MYLDKRKNEIYTFAGALFELVWRMKRPNLFGIIVLPLICLGWLLALAAVLSSDDISYFGVTNSGLIKKKQ